MRIKFFRILEYLYFITMFLLLMGAYLPLWRSNGGVLPIDQMEGDPLQRNLILGGYLISLIYLPLYFRSFVKIIYFDPLPLVFVFLAILSVFWSKYPDIAFRRSMALMLTTLFGIVIYLRFNTVDFLRLLNISLWVAMVGSIIMVFLKPEWGTEIYFNEVVWRGVFTQKNLLGFYSALLISINILFVFDLRRRKLKVFKIAQVGILLIILALSKSTSALVLTFMIGLLIIFLSFIAHLKKDNLIVILAFSVLVLLVLMLFGGKLFEVFLSLVNKEETLTGRIPLWQTLFKLGLEKSALGYGYGTFWLGWSGAESASVWQTVNWMPAHAHNGYLDVWLQLGFVGVSIFLGMIYRFLARFSINSVIRDDFTKLFFLLGFFILVKNFIDTVIPRHNSFIWVLFVFIYYTSRFSSQKLQKSLEAKNKK